MLRRRLGEMTQKFEALELRYQSLKDVGVTEAESNFERFKKQVEENTKGVSVWVFYASHSLLTCWPKSGRCTYRDASSHDRGAGQSKHGDRRTALSDHHTVIAGRDEQDGQEGARDVVGEIAGGNKNFAVETFSGSSAVRARAASGIEQRRDKGRR